MILFYTAMTMYRVQLRMGLIMIMIAMILMILMGMACHGPIIMETGSMNMELTS